MADKLHEWQEKFELKEQLTQGDFEALEIAMLKLPGSIYLSFRRSGLSIESGAYLRAAIAAGWVLAPDCKAITDKKSGETTYLYDGLDVDELHPVKVNWLGQQVINKHDSVMGEDPKN